jgi:hypothetical protein
MSVGIDSPAHCTLGDSNSRTFDIITAGGHLFQVRKTGRRGWIIRAPVRQKNFIPTSGPLLLGIC